MLCPEEGKIRNPNNQIPHLTHDTTSESDKNTRKHHLQEASPFPAGDNSMTRRGRSVRKLLEGFNMFDGTNLTLILMWSKQIDFGSYERSLTYPDVSSPSTYQSRYMYKRRLNYDEDSTLHTTAYQSKRNPTIKPRWAQPKTQHQTQTLSSIDKSIDTSLCRNHHSLRSDKPACN